MTVYTCGIWTEHTLKSSSFLNLKPLTVSVFFTLLCERIFIETYSIRSRCYRTGKYTVHRHIHASFSPDILQAGAVKGLILKGMYSDFTLQVKVQKQ